MPSTPFIGVRISWLMLARNSLLARLASSARILRLGELRGALRDLDLEVFLVALQLEVAGLDLRPACR